MNELRNIYNYYAKSKEDVKKYILTITSCVLKNMKLSPFFEGFGKIYIPNSEASFDYGRQKVLLCPELIINNIFDSMEYDEIENDNLYPFIYAYITNVLLFQFKNMQSYIKSLKGVFDLQTEIFTNLKQECNIYRPTLLGLEDDMLYETIDLLNPLYRSNYFFAINETLKMIKGTGYFDIEEYFKEDYYDILLGPYLEGGSPIETLIDINLYADYLKDVMGMSIIERPFKGLENLEFYDEDENVMAIKMMQYSLEDRFKYGMPLTNEELSSIERKLG